MCTSSLPLRSASGPFVCLYRAKPVVRATLLLNKSLFFLFSFFSLAFFLLLFYYLHYNYHVYVCVWLQQQQQQHQPVFVTGYPSMTTARSKKSIVHVCTRTNRREREREKRRCRERGTNLFDNCCIIAFIIHQISSWRRFSFSEGKKSARASQREREKKHRWDINRLFSKPFSLQWYDFGFSLRRRRRMDMIT